MVKIIDLPRISQIIVLNQVYVAIDVTLQGSVRIVAVLVVVCIAVIEIGSTRISQMLFCIVLDCLQLVAVTGDDEAVNQSVLPLIVHAVSFNTSYVAVLVVGYALGVTFFAILVDIIYFWVAKESKSLSK